ncbi:MAG: radical SAM protein [Desulfobacterales bacterium]|nr:radical SAM protein [Desulfobacterales bacterium]
MERARRWLNRMPLKKLSIFLKLKIEKPFIVPVFIPHLGCPYQCAFCNQTVITGVKNTIPLPEQLHRQIDTFLGYRTKQRNKTQIAFFGGNFLGLDKADVKYLLNEADKFVKAGSVDSIRFSTRPDTVNNQQLDIIEKYPVSTIELGVQSMNDKVLSLVRRGHTSLDTEKAAVLLKERNYETGMQLMVGLPGDDEAGVLATGRKITELCPDFVRIYPTVVVAGSLLAKWYKKGKYSPLSLEECVTLVKKLYILFREKNIPVIRMGLQASDDLNEGTSVLAGPYHPAFGHLVHSEIFLDMAEELLTSHFSLPTSHLCFLVNPRSISKMRGMKNRNIEILKEKFSVKSIRIIPDSSVAEDDLSLKFQIPNNRCDCKV